MRLVAHRPQGVHQTGLTPDTQTFPTTPASWTYRAIYRVDDSQVGVWSQPASVTVPA